MKEEKLLQGHPKHGVLAELALLFAITVVGNIRREKEAKTLPDEKSSFSILFLDPVVVCHLKWINQRISFKYLPDTDVTWS